LQKGLDDANKKLDKTTQTAKNTGGVMGELEGKFKGLINPASLVAGAVTGLGVAFVNTIKTTQSYAASVRDLALAQGEGAEQASITLQVLDDFEISAEDVTTATRALKEKGLVPTIDTLADLADQFVSIEDPAKRLKFAQDNLGRSYSSYLNVLSQGGDALRKNATQVNKNLILTDEQIKSTEEYRLALDNLNDTVEGLKVSKGIGFIEELNGGIWQLEHAKDLLFEMEKLRRGGMGGAVLGFTDLNDIQIQAEYNIKLKEGRAAQDEYLKAVFASKGGVHELAVAEEQAAEAVKAISDENASFIDTLKNVGSNLEDYQNAQAAANQELADGKITAEEHAAKMGELAASYEEAKNRIILSIVEMKLASDGWTDAELTSYLKVGEQLGVFTEDMRKETMEVLKQADLLADGYSDMGDQIYHTGERAGDSTRGFAAMKDSAATLGAVIRREATPAVGGLKSQINGLPPSGTSWAYYFQITTSGNVPRLPPGGSREQGGHKGVDEQWTGGPMNKNGFTVVGDMPGGGFGPYTEVIGPDGYVYNARDSKKLKDTGVLDGARSLAYGGEGPGVFTPGGPSPIVNASIRKRERKNRPSTGSSPVLSSGGDDGDSAGIVNAIVDAIPEATEGIGGAIAANINNTVVSSMAAAQMAATSASVQNQALFREMLGRFDALIAKTASEQGIGRAIGAQNSKYS
jgi:hypothetical protein